jgi:flagellar biosynthesis protein FliR
MFGEMFRAGLVFAAPVMVLLLLVSLVIGLLARAVPGLNVVEVGFTLRVLVALGALFLFAPLLDPAMRGLHQELLRWLERGLAAI